MYLVGSRLLGLENEKSDYDYVEFAEISGGTYTATQNRRIDEHSHCYLINKEYRDKVARFEVDDPNDFHFLFNPEDYRAGMITENPFDYKDIWIDKLKSMDFYHKHFYAKKARVFSKRFYHIVYNLECLKQNTLEPTMDRVKKFHDLQARQQEDYLAVIEEIKAL